jgi:exonuclease III
MKIATFNLNGVNGRLPVLMRWLAETKPDVACLQVAYNPRASLPNHCPRATCLSAGLQTLAHSLLAPERLAGRMS